MSPPDADADDALVAATLDGDDDAFAEIVRRHKRRVFATASRFARDAHQLEDLCQEVFLRAFRHLGKFRRDAPFEHWLARLTVSACYDFLRRERRHRGQLSLDEIFKTHAGETLLITFGIPVPPKTEPADFFTFLQQQGYLRVWLEGEIHRVDEAPRVKRLPPVVAVLQDRLAFTAENRSRVTEAIETALRFGKGKISFIAQPSSSTSTGSQPSTLNSQLPFSTGWHCAHCDLDISPPSPGLFSFNHPHGACPTCRGFGRTIATDLLRAIPDRSLSIAQGVVKPFQTENGRECQQDLLRCAAAKDVDTICPFDELPKADQDWVLYGEKSAAKGEDLWAAGLWYGVKGFFAWLETKSYKMHVRVLLSRYRSYTTCPDCSGGRYQPATLNYRVAGKTLPDLMAMPVAALREQIRNPQSAIRNDASTEMLLGEVSSRLGYLAEVGLGYLSLMA